MRPGNASLSVSYFPFNEKGFYLQKAAQLGQIGGLLFFLYSYLYDAKLTCKTKQDESYAGHRETFLHHCNRNN